MLRLRVRDRVRVTGQRQACVEVTLIVRNIGCHRSLPGLLPRV